MTEVREVGTLTPRDREILKDVILAYILNAEPVSSRSVAKQGRLGLSAATIRNVMADLVDSGYLAQPHTSAGRIPTRAAYHLFIESMMELHGPSASERRYIEDNLKGTPADAEQLMEITTHLLSELSHQVGVVVGVGRVVDIGTVDLRAAVRGLHFHLRGCCGHRSLLKSRPTGAGRRVGLKRSISTRSARPGRRSR